MPFFFKRRIQSLRRIGYYKCWLHVSHLFRFSLYINDVFARVIFCSFTSAKLRIKQEKIE